MNRIIAAIARDALVVQAEIARLSFPLAGYRRAKFDCSSDKHEPEQLELVLETVEVDQAEGLVMASPTAAASGR